MSPYITLTANDLLNIWSGSESTSSLRIPLFLSVGPLQCVAGLTHTFSHIYPSPLPLLRPCLCPEKGTLTDRSHTRSAAGSLSLSLSLSLDRKVLPVWGGSVGSAGFGRRPRSMWPKFKCELQGCQWERTLCKWAQTVRGPSGARRTWASPRLTVLISSKWATWLQGFWSARRPSTSISEAVHRLRTQSTRALGPRQGPLTTGLLAHLEQPA